MRKSVNPAGCGKFSQDETSRKDRPGLFTDYSDDNAVIDDQVRFLARIYKKCPRDGFVFLAFRSKKAKHWAEEGIKCGVLRSEIRDLLNDYPRAKYDLYFCPNPFSKKRRKSELAEKTVWAWCDIDESDPRSYQPLPNILLLTSPKRYQGLWRFDKLLKPQKAEAYSKALTYNFGGDRGGWSVTKYLRIPGSYNHKPGYFGPTVLLLSESWKPLSKRPDLLEDETPRNRLSKRQPIHIGPIPKNTRKIIERLRPKMSATTRLHLDAGSAFGSDKSVRIFSLVAGLHEVGATPEEIAAIVWESPFFLEKHGKNQRKLHEEVCRILTKLEGKQ